MLQCNLGIAMKSPIKSNANWERGKTPTLGSWRVRKIQHHFYSAGRHRVFFFPRVVPVGSAVCRCWPVEKLPRDSPINERQVSSRNLPEKLPNKFDTIRLTNFPPTVARRTLEANPGKADRKVGTGSAGREGADTSRRERPICQRRSYSESGHHSTKRCDVKPPTEIQRFGRSQEEPVSEASLREYQMANVLLLHQIGTAKFGIDQAAQKLLFSGPRLGLF
ncbi:uncharacterized protein LOC129760949 isoform X2 [Uranotaenia lowii]|uniref:uncharacterized protein LOC129760949 isoform X2 n=1 Tax=Uranotaenia lowii TaxID=190385 RepID=UPI00247A6CD2|nr:uncharacterized protein LOC129760949 isoform X2 [Uranotaenia lowii]